VKTLKFSVILHKLSTFSCALQSDLKLRNTLEQTRTWKK